MNPKLSVALIVVKIFLVSVVICQVGSAGELFKGGSQVVVKEKVNWLSSTFHLFSASGTRLGKVGVETNPLTNQALSLLNDGDNIHELPFSIERSDADGTLITLSDIGTKVPLISIKRYDSHWKNTGDEWTITQHRENNIPKNLPVQIAAKVSLLERQKIFSTWLKSASKKVALSTAVLVGVGLLVYMVRMKQSHRKLKKKLGKLTDENRMLNINLGQAKRSVVQLEDEKEVSSKEFAAQSADYQACSILTESATDFFRNENGALVHDLELEEERREALENYASELEYVGTSPFPREMREILAQEAITSFVSNHQRLFEISEERVASENDRLSELRRKIRKETIDSGQTEFAASGGDRVTKLKALISSFFPVINSH